MGILSNRDGVFAHERGAWLQVVHVGLVLEFTVVAAMVAQTVPRFDADERCLLLVGAPEGNDGTTVSLASSGINMSFAIFTYSNTA